MLDGTPKQRRQFIDWGLFHLESTFLEPWRRYRKALQQRNALLKSQKSSSSTHQQAMMEVWEHEMAQYGTIVGQQRDGYITRLAPHFSIIAERFLALQSHQMHYQSGWERSNELLVVLQQERGRDIRYGFTNSGPHRGDFRLLVNGIEAQKILSRGQMKLIVLALKLAQVQLLNQRIGRYGAILIDDLAAELDRPNQLQLLTFLAELDSQLFITATTDQLFDGFPSSECEWFTINQGQIQQESSNE